MNHENPLDQPPVPPTQQPAAPLTASKMNDDDVLPLIDYLKKYIKENNSASANSPDVDVEKMVKDLDDEINGQNKEIFDDKDEVFRLTTKIYKARDIKKEIEGKKESDVNNSVIYKLTEGLVKRIFEQLKSVNDPLLNNLSSAEKPDNIYEFSEAEIKKINDSLDDIVKKVNTELESSPKKKNKPLKQYFDKELLNKASGISRALNLDDKAKTKLLSYILAKYDEYTELIHCEQMCKDAEIIINYLIQNKEENNFKIPVANTIDWLEKKALVDKKEKEQQRDTTSIVDGKKSLDDKTIITNIKKFLLDEEENPDKTHFEIDLKNICNELKKSFGAKSDINFVTVTSLTAKLHNIGKICTPSSLLKKPDYLGLSEREDMANHIIGTREILRQFGFSPEICEAALMHHYSKEYKKIIASIRKEEGGKEKIEDDKITEVPVPASAIFISILDRYNACNTDRPQRPWIPTINTIDILIDDLKKNDNTDIEKAIEKEIIKLFIYILTTNERQERRKI